MDHPTHQKGNIGIFLSLGPREPEALDQAFPGSRDTSLRSCGCHGGGSRLVGGGLRAALALEEAGEHGQGTTLHL